MNTWWQRRTLRFRLGVWYAGMGTLLLALFSATIYLFVAQRMARPLDYQLRLDVAEVQRRLVAEPEGRVRWDGKELVRGRPGEWTGPWFELWDESGQLIHRQWPFDDGQLERLPTPPVKGRETISIYNVAPQIRLRTLGGPFAVPGGQPGWMLRVMRAHEPAGDALGALLGIIVVALPIVVTLLVVGGYFLTRRWLQPLDRMVAAADRITAEDLSQRLPVPNPHDELGRLGAVFNVTLQRLEDSFVTLERFVADASHELRTPLTTLRSVGEVGLRRSRTVEEYREIIGSMLEEAQRLQQLINRLLELAQAEGGARMAQVQSIQVDEFVAECASELGTIAEFNEQRFELKVVPCTVTTDPVILRQALQNLIDNALRYSPVGGTVALAVAVTDRGCVISVTDIGPGIPPEGRPRLASRFFRAGGGSPRGSGFGLGLAITRAYLRVLGGTMEYEPVLPQGSCFRLILPLEPEARAGGA
jgi:two-component system OmpR family sensor kinase